MQRRDSEMNINNYDEVDVEVDSKLDINSCDEDDAKANSEYIRS